MSHYKIETGIEPKSRVEKKLSIIREGFNNDKSGVTLAKELGVTHQSISYLTNKYNIINWQTTRSIINNELAVKIAKDFNSGLNTSEIESKYNITSAKINRLVRVESGKTLYGEERYHRDLEITVLYNTGKSANEIIETINIKYPYVPKVSCEETIYNIVNKLGKNINKKGKNGSTMITKSTLEYLRVQRAKGTTYASIANNLTNKGVLTPSGKEFTIGNLSAIYYNQITKTKNKK